MKIPQTRPIIAVLTLLFCFYMIRDVLHLPPGHDKTIAVQILSALTALLGFVYGYYFGATHKAPTATEQPIKNQNKMQKQVFWGIGQLEDLITDESSPFNGMMAKSIPQLSDNFEVMLDDGSVPVLVVNTLTSVSLTFVYGPIMSEPAEFIGGRPVRKPR